MCSPFQVPPNGCVDGQVGGAPISPEVPGARRQDPRRHCQRRLGQE